MNATIVKIEKLHDDVIMPSHATSGSACFDIHAYVPDKQMVTIYDRFNSAFDVPCSDDGTRLEAGERMLVPTGFALSMPYNYSVRLHARSGISLKNGVALANSQGIIDADYREEVFVLLHNTTQQPFIINHGDRICQGELVKDERVEFDVVEERPVKKTDRDGGFGSTGD